MNIFIFNNILWRGGIKTACLSTSKIYDSGDSLNILNINIGLTQSIHPFSGKWK